MSQTRPRTSYVIDPISPLRYGVFLRPSAEFMHVSLRAFDLVKNQFGLHAAAAYPPHVTLVGNFAIDVPERVLMERLDAVLAQQKRLSMHSSGLRLSNGFALGYNMNEYEAGGSNLEVKQLVSTLFDAITPVRLFPSTDRGMPARREEGSHNYGAHLTVVGHDGVDAPDLAMEIQQVLTELDLDVTGPWWGDNVHLLRLHSQDWSGRYWETMQWAHVKTWRLNSQ